MGMCQDVVNCQTWPHNCSGPVRPYLKSWRVALKNGTYHWYEWSFKKDQNVPYVIEQWEWLPTDPEGYVPARRVITGDPKNTWSCQTTYPGYVETAKPESPVSSESSSRLSPHALVFTPSSSGSSSPRLPGKQPSSSSMWKQRIPRPSREAVQAAVERYWGPRPLPPYFEARRQERLGRERLQELVV
jgi:hypothetical protein